MTAGHAALVCGATGLVGRACVRRLLDDPAYARVAVLVRRPWPDAASRLVQHVVDFDRLDEHAAALEADHVYCALGTTMRKAGSRERFRRVDLEYPRAVARLAFERGARHFGLVSALGANPSSRIFYNRVKGETEAAIRAVGFASAAILRPAVLLGPRDEVRIAESIGKVLSFALPPAARPVRADDVAAVMVWLAKEERPGCRVVESREIRALARSSARP